MIADIVLKYIEVQYTEEEKTFITDMLAKLQTSFTSRRAKDKINAVPQLIFLNMIGSDTSWADFNVLDVMSLDQYSAKRIAYTTAAQTWYASSDVVLMATNRIQKDLNSAQMSIVSFVLSSIPSFLTPHISQCIYTNVIQLMNSGKPYIRQKAILTFYRICDKYPEALKDGFAALRARLDDSDSGVVFSVLTVINELCFYNATNFIPLIPKLYKIAQGNPTDLILMKLLAIFTKLASVEPRLGKRLSPMYLETLGMAYSSSVIYELVQSILTIPLTQQPLLIAAASRIRSFVDRIEPNIHFLGLCQYLQLMKLLPKMVIESRELITECLDSYDSTIRMMALELLASLVNRKTIDGIINKLLEHFKDAPSIQFRNVIISRVVEICSQNDYELIRDFDWYISVLVDFIDINGFTVYGIFAEQFLDLAIRVPVTRPKLIIELSKMFEKVGRYPESEPLLLACAHIIGEYFANADHFQDVIKPITQTCSSRIQSAYVSAAFRIFLKADNKPVLYESFEPQLKLINEGINSDLQDMSNTMIILLPILVQNEEVNQELQDILQIGEDEDEELDEIALPADFNEPILIFNEEEEKAKPDTKIRRRKSQAPSSRRHGHKARHQSIQPEHPIVLKKSRDLSSKPTIDISSVSSDSFVNVPPKPSEEEDNEQSSVLQHKHKHKRRHTNEYPSVAENETLFIGQKSIEVIDDIVYISLYLTNKTNSSFSAIDTQLINSPGLKIVDVSKIETVEPQSSFDIQIGIQPSSTNKLNIARIAFAPICSGIEVLEARFRILPSMFLRPCLLEKIPEEDLICEEIVQMDSHIKPKAFLSCITNVLHSKVNETDTKSIKSLTSKSSTDEKVHCIVSFDGIQVSINLKSSNEELANLLIKEIEMKLQSL